MNFFIILPQLTVHNIISPERFSITKKQQPRNGLYLRRSEEHTSELQSQSNLVCRLLLEKKKKKQNLKQDKQDLEGFNRLSHRIHRTEPCTLHQHYSPPLNMRCTYDCTTQIVSATPHPRC